MPWTSRKPELFILQAVPCDFALPPCGIICSGSVSGNVQDAAAKAEEKADPTAAKVVDKAGDTAHKATKTAHQKWDAVKPEEKVDQAADKATKQVKVCLSAFE